MPVARKVKGYQAYSIKSQKVVREGAADFRGVLTGPAVTARSPVRALLSRCRDTSLPMASAAARA